jgi:sugar phosphate permease
LYNFGIGYQPALRSFLTMLVSKDEIGLLFTLMSLIDSVGALAATPAMALAFSFGIQKGGMWIALPFFLTSVIFTISGLFTWATRAEERKDGGEEVEATGQEDDTQAARDENE